MTSPTIDIAPEVVQLYDLSLERGINYHKVANQTNLDQVLLIPVLQ